MLAGSSTCVSVCNQREKKEMDLFDQSPSCAQEKRRPIPRSAAAAQVNAINVCCFSLSILLAISGKIGRGRGGRVQLSVYTPTVWMSDCRGWKARFVACGRTKSFVSNQASNGYNLTCGVPKVISKVV